jgi:hypothetical protein
LVRLIGKGDMLRLGPPVGHFALNTGSDRDMLLVGGGTGLAPLKALVDQVARQGYAVDRHERFENVCGLAHEPGRDLQVTGLRLRAIRLIA